jgi:hypothetical protein
MWCLEQSRCIRAAAQDMTPCGRARDSSRATLCFILSDCMRAQSDGIGEQGKTCLVGSAWRAVNELDERCFSSFVLRLTY